MEFRLFRGTENPRNSVSNPSAEEKTNRNSVLLNKNRSKLSEFPSENFSGREYNSEFRSVAQNMSKLSEFRSEPFREREKMTFEVRTNHFVTLLCLFCKTNFL